MAHQEGKAIPHWISWPLAALLVLVLGAWLAVSVFGWNWLRAPIERYTADKTGRVLAISGDLQLSLEWPQLRLHAAGVTFDNPAWAKESKMLAAQGVDLTLDLPQLMRGRFAFPEVRLDRVVVFLEQGSEGRKSWLLDRLQQDEAAVIPIGRVALEYATVGYDDVAQGTRIRAALSTDTAGAGNSAGLAFTAQGSFKGQALQAKGTGGPLLALRDASRPYALAVDATIGRTAVHADGSVTGLLALTAVDMRLTLRGDSLEQLYPLLGMAFPGTRAYATQGHLLHSGTQWRYEDFAGHIGQSDITGALQVNTAGKRPALSADLMSKLLDLNDLGPVIGARAGSVAKAVSAPAQARVLPDLAFRTERWNSVDAEVQLRAKTLRHAAALPLENLVTHLSLRDAVLTLEPLDFGLAGGQLSAHVTLDGRSQPLQAKARVQVKKILLARLFPTVELAQSSIGQVNGEFDLAGQGNSVAAMLGSANGKLGLVVTGGEISKLMMEKSGLHLWEILALNVRGDRLVKLRCAVADFDVSRGKMLAQALVFDTEINTLLGSGSIDLAQEKLDLTLIPKTKATSPVALRSPIYVRGTLARPQVQVDKGRVAARALGAVALGLLNPLLALLPLVDTGPGSDSDCRQLVREAKAMPAVPKPAASR
jgi:AsmA protein